MGEHNKALSAVKANRFLGGRLWELRLGARMSQAFLAERMAERGFRWYQNTVSRIEAATQEATFKEVMALTEIFGVPLESFSSPEEAEAS